MSQTTSVQEHYDRFLADHYTWSAGGFAAQVERARSCFEAMALIPASGQALDLGAGSGFQTAALQQGGFEVTAVDTCSKLLQELEQRCGRAGIQTKCDDLRNLAAFGTRPWDLICCMGDTLLLLDHADQARRFLEQTVDRLSPGGKLVLSFRDLTSTPAGERQWIAVRQEADRAFHCHLSFESERVRVEDLVLLRTTAPDRMDWSLQQSAYWKLRLSPDQVASWLQGPNRRLKRWPAAPGLALFLLEKY
ncbi:MAG: class I SAM-dependent methyltransferase [Planctomycetota bacterium]|nr:MAG: class I SAM-dependent methyltransferase [Planctomycetota bacterium]